MKWVYVENCYQTLTLELRCFCDFHWVWARIVFVYERESGRKLPREYDRCTRVQHKLNEIRCYSKIEKSHRLPWLIAAVLFNLSAIYETIEAEKSNSLVWRDRYHTHTRVLQNHKYLIRVLTCLRNWMWSPFKCRFRDRLRLITTHIYGDTRAKIC